MVRVRLRDRRRYSFGSAGDAAGEEVEVERVLPHAAGRVRPVNPSCRHRRHTEGHTAGHEKTRRTARVGGEHGPLEQRLMIVDDDDGCLYFSYVFFAYGVGSGVP